LENKIKYNIEANTLEMTINAISAEKKDIYKKIAEKEEEGKKIILFKISF
jgi:hypothetical protein